MSTRLWNIPYPRNPFFTGREELLSRLRTELLKDQVTALSQPQAISGLGGIGKTQLALEYAYRFRQDYRVVLWVSAATQDTLTTEVTALARMLELPERDAQDQTKIAAAVERWLQGHDGWLLILDNADDLTLVEDFLPPNHKGTVLFTTRSAYAGPLTVVLEVEPMDEQEGMLLLLRRARLLARDGTLEHVDPQRLAEARATVTALDGLPLALDQAGAYIEETKSSLASYLTIYHTRRKQLLARRSRSRSAHPDPVATTWSLAFEKVEAENQTAITLLRLCAFLASDAIPEEVVSEGRLDDYELNEAIEVVLRFSLVKRQSEEHLLSMHRLVQAVIQDSMEEPRQREWTQRAVRAVNAAFPEVEHQTWPQCDRLLPHALLCATWIEQEQMTAPEAARLLNQTGGYLKERARYMEAEPLYVQALAIREQQLGALHPDTATSLNNLALLYRAQGKYSQAEPLYVRALAIREQQLGPQHPDTAQSLNNLANLYSNQEKYEQAEPLYQRALTIKEQQLGPQHPDTAQSLNNLALLYRAQGKSEQAEPLYQRALEISEQQLGPQHPDTANSLNNLALLYHNQGKYELAEPLYQRALAIHKQQLGPWHPHTATSLNNLALFYHNQGKYELAEPLLKRALSIREQQMGPLHPDTAQGLNNLAGLYYGQGKYEQAEPLYLRALSIDEHALGSQHPTTQTIRTGYAHLLRTMGRDAEAAALDPP